MKVVLTDTVKSLGNIGEVVNVSAGFARNYLIPQKLGVVANEQNMELAEDQKRRLSKKIEEVKEQAIVLKSKIDGISLEFSKRVGGNGQLFGTITNKDIAEALAQKEIEVEKRLVTIESVIKTLGSYPVKIKLFADVEAELQVKVVMDEKQAEEMKARQASGKKKKKANSAEQEQVDEAETETETETETESV